MVARWIAACSRWPAVGPRYGRLGPCWWIRVSKVVRRVLCQRKYRGKIGKGGRKGERRRGFLGREQNGTQLSLVPSVAAAYFVAEG